MIFLTGFTVNLLIKRALPSREAVVSWNLIITNISIMPGSCKAVSSPVNFCLGPGLRLSRCLNLYRCQKRRDYDVSRRTGSLRPLHQSLCPPSCSSLWPSLSWFVFLWQRFNFAVVRNFVNYRIYLWPVFAELMSQCEKRLSRTEAYRDRVTVEMRACFLVVTISVICNSFRSDSSEGKLGLLVDRITSKCRLI